MSSHEGSSSWVHIAVSANATKSRFFINGSFVGEADAVIDGSSMEEIGAYDGDDTQVFAEFLDEVAFWDAVLSDEQIKKIYDSQKKINQIV